MGFVDWKPPAKEKCGHRLPNSNGAKEFGIGTVWRCDVCGAAFELEKIDHGDQRDPGPYDRWKRRIDMDGPDTRRQAQPPSDYRPPRSSGYYGPYGSGPL